MKFKLLSDLHLEFYGRRPFYRAEATPEWEPAPTAEDKDTVLLLPGDIHVGRKAMPWLKKMCGRFYEVVYVLGNHEFYNHELNEVKDFWDEACIDMPDNFTFLDDAVIYIEDTRIIGGTLWTGVTDPHAIWMGPKRMTDYQITTVREHGKVRKMNVQDTNKAHFETVNFIREELQKPWVGKTIVMTHHLPHELCVAEFFKGNALNAFFMTDLDHIIRNFDIDVWVHGHTHNNVDVEVHGTRILCNPMGYHGVQLNQDFNEELVFHV
jgi:predicted phosphodiesterase